MNVIDGAKRAAKRLFVYLSYEKRKVVVAATALVLIVDALALVAHLKWHDGTVATASTLVLVLALNAAVMLLLGMLLSESVRFRLRDYLSRDSVFAMQSAEDWPSPFPAAVREASKVEVGSELRPSPLPAAVRQLSKAEAAPEVRPSPLPAAVLQAPKAEAASEAPPSPLPAAVRDAPKNEAASKPARQQEPVALSADTSMRQDTRSPVEARARHQLLRDAIDRLPPPQPSAPRPRTYPVPDFGSDVPCVTVVVPLWNEERFVGDTIRSLKAQTVRNFEVFIVDDASTDNSAAVALKAVGTDSRFKLVRHLRNSGLSASRNTGLRLAQTPYITFLDSDDFLLKDALEIRLRRIGQLDDDRVAGVFCGVVSAPEHVKADFVPKSRAFKGRVHTFVSIAGECPFNAHAPLLRTDLLRMMGGFDETLKFGCEDWDLWQRTMRHGYWFEPVHLIAAVYRRKAGSMVRSMPVEHMRSGQRIFDWVHAPLPPEEIVPGTPFVFTQSLDAYRREDTFLQRTVQYGAMAYMHSEKQFEEFLATIPGDMWPYGVRHFNVPYVITQGLKRYLAVDEAEGESFEKDLVAARDAVFGHYSEAALRNRRADQVEPVRPNPDVAFFAANAKQAAMMAELFVELREEGIRAVLVSVETVAGDQGVESAWASRSLPYATYNTFVLREWRLTPAVAVVMRPYDDTIKRLIVPGGKPVVELVDPTAPVDLPDENLPAEPHAVATVEEAKGAIRRLLQAGPDQVTPDPARTDPVLTPKRAGTLAPFVLHKEERLDLAPDYERMLAFKDRYKGERCFIIGNGPSLNTLDLTKLKNEYTFAVNGIFYKKEEMGFDPTFYVVEDSSVMKENLDAIRSYEAENKFFPTIYRSLHPAEENVQFFLMNRGFYERDGASFCVPRFSTDAARRVFCGQSVTHINLQLAYYFGFSKVYLIGMDFSYVIPKSAIVKGDLIISTEDDPNHFHSSYFGAGKSWKDPKLHRVKLNYEISRDIFSSSGREIINATSGGSLEVFRRELYDSLF